MYLIDQLMFFGLYKTGQSDWQCMSCTYNRFENIFTETHFPQQAILSFTKYLPDSKPNKVHLIF